MTLTLPGLQNLLRAADFRIEALNTPTSPGQPQVFQVRPSTLQFLPDTQTLPDPIASIPIDIPPIDMPQIDIPAFTVPNAIPPVIDIPPIALPPLDIPPIPVPAKIQSIPSLIPTADILNAADHVRIAVDWQVQDLAGTRVEQDKAILWFGVKKTKPTGGVGRAGESGIGTVVGVTTETGATGAPPGHGFGHSDEAGVDTVTGLESEPFTLAQSLQTTVMVLPDFVDLVRDFPPPPVKTLYLSATVTLSYGAIEAKLTLPRFPITVPALPIPTLAVFFRTPNLGINPNGSLRSDGQYVFIMVPGNSPIADLPGLRAILKTLSQTMATVDTIKTVAGLAGDVLPALSQLVEGANALLRALNAHKVGENVGIAFVAADRISDLNDIDTIKRSFFHNDIEADETISSLVFVAPPGRELMCKQDTQFGGRGLRVETGDACIAIVNALTKAPVAVLPNPVGDLKGPTTHQAINAPALNNSFSSIAFL